MIRHVLHSHTAFLLHNQPYHHFFSFFTNFFFTIPINFFYFLFLKKYTFRLRFSTIQKLFHHTPYSCTFRKFSPYTFSTIPKIRHTPLGKFSPYTFSIIPKIRTYTFRKIFIIHLKHIPKFSPYIISKI